MYIKKLIITFAAALACAALFAQRAVTVLPGTPPQSPDTLSSGGGFAERLAELSSQIETIECDFVQIRHVSVMSGDDRRNGKFYYRRPGNICLLFDEPEGDMIVMDGQRFKIVAMGKRNVTDMESNPMLAQMKDILEACMTGDIGMFERGSAVEYADTGDTYVVVAVPKAKRARKYVKSITLTFDKGDMSLSRMRMDEPLGDYTEYIFSGKKFNVHVDGSRFEM